MKSAGGPSFGNISIAFLVACTRLYKPLRRSVRRCSRSTRLMAIGLVVRKDSDLGGMSTVFAKQNNIGQWRDTSVNSNANARCPIRPTVLKIYIKNYPGVDH